MIEKINYNDGDEIVEARQYVERLYNALEYLRQTTKDDEYEISSYMSIEDLRATLNIGVNTSYYNYCELKNYILVPTAQIYAKKGYDLRFIEQSKGAGSMRVVYGLAIQLKKSENNESSNLKENSILPLSNEWDKYYKKDFKEICSVAYAEDKQYVPENISVMCQSDNKIGEFYWSPELVKQLLDRYGMTKKSISDTSDNATATVSLYIVDKNSVNSNYFNDILSNVCNSGFKTIDEIWAECKQQILQDYDEVDLQVPNLAYYVERAGLTYKRTIIKGAHRRELDRAIAFCREIVDSPRKIYYLNELSLKLDECKVNKYDYISKFSVNKKISLFNELNYMKDLDFKIEATPVIHKQAKLPNERFGVELYVYSIADDNNCSENVTEENLDTWKSLNTPNTDECEQLTIDSIDSIENKENTESTDSTDVHIDKSGLIYKENDNSLLCVNENSCIVEENDSIYSNYFIDEFVKFYVTRCKQSIENNVLTVAQALDIISNEMCKKYPKYFSSLNLSSITNLYNILITEKHLDDRYNMCDFDVDDSKSNDTEVASEQGTEVPEKVIDEINADEVCNGDGITCEDIYEGLENYCNNTNNNIEELKNIYQIKAKVKYSFLSRYTVFFIQYECASEDEAIANMFRTLYEYDKTLIIKDFEIVKE